jgi:hypothetical protein
VVLGERYRRKGEGFVSSVGVAVFRFVESSLGSSDSISEVARSSEGGGEDEALLEDVALWGVASAKGVEGRTDSP